MNNQELALEILKTIIPIVTAFLSFYLGRASATNTTKKEVLKERLEGFYLPFMEYISKHLVTTVDFIDHYEKMNDFVDLLIDRSRYADTKTQILIFQLIQNLTSGNIDEWSSGFSQITENVFEEHKKLCRQLRYPAPAYPPFLPSTLRREDLRPQAEEVLAVIREIKDQE